MLFTDWMKLLARNQFRVNPWRLGLAAGITLISTFNSKMRLAQLALHGHQISRTPIPDDPIFILGHWRSGTTFMHELLSVDERFVSPTTCQCFCANHFLLTQQAISKLLWFMIPSRRPMDNVSAGWNEPQEDEFALCAMGLPSPYLRMAFPNGRDEYLDYLDMNLGPANLNEWKAGMNEFLRRLAMSSDKRIVLKSPTHTGRLQLLAEMFPNAKFVHIVRNPYDVVPSTIRLWKSLDDVQGLQIPQHEHLTDYVHRAYARMYGGFRNQRSLIDNNRIIDIKYEDLVEDGCGILQTVYERLGLGDFESVRPQLQAALDGKRNYKRNQHSLDDSLVASINENWRQYFEDYDYPVR